MHLHRPTLQHRHRDFVYNDSFVDREDSWRHSKWCEFMFQRLTLAKDLLREDGVIFVSIDDNEMAALRLLMDRVFGAGNFVANCIWQKRSRQLMTTRRLLLCMTTFWHIKPLALGSGTYCLAAKRRIANTDSTMKRELFDAVIIPATKVPRSARTSTTLSNNPILVRKFGRRKLVYGPIPKRSTKKM